MLVDSIESENYIHSYVYAEVVAELNSKNLDAKMTVETLKKIHEYFATDNYQGSSKWSYFLGHLHRHSIINQTQLFS